MTKTNQEKILNVAEKRMLQHGYRKVTMDEIACDLRMSKNTIYKEYRSKIAIAQALLERLKNKIPEALQAYEEILPLQPKAYRSHQEWIDNAKPEAVATALTILRTQEHISYAEFTEKVKEIGQQMNILTV